MAMSSADCHRELSLPLHSASCGSARSAARSALLEPGPQLGLPIGPQLVLKIGPQLVPRIGLQLGPLLELGPLSLCQLTASSSRQSARRSLSGLTGKSFFSINLFQGTIYRVSMNEK